MNLYSLMQSISELDDGEKEQVNEIFAVARTRGWFVSWGNVEELRIKGKEVLDTWI